MKKFLFVIPQSPPDRISPFRKSLMEISLLSLKNQKSREWEAVFLGENSRTEEQLHFMNLGGISKEEKLHHFADWLLKQNEKPEYLIRFDDDDLISPFVLEKISGMKMDAYVDEWHWFYDSSSGKCSAQKRPWFPNTIIHKTEHALSTFGQYHKGVFSEQRRPVLFQNDHSQTWHKYYADKKIIFAEKNQPVYLRILSPTSISSGDGAAFDKTKYENYRKGFGFWNNEVPEGFSEYISELNSVWKKYFGNQLDYPVKFADKLKSGIKGLFN